MKIHEYQAKQVLARYGVPVPRGDVAETPLRAGEIARELGGPVVVKAQIHAGGRGKGGGIRPAASPDEAEKVAGEILGMTLVTHQTGPQGRMVHRVLVEEAREIVRELYLGIVVDRKMGRPVIMASEAGGVDIEQVAAETPEKILTTTVDPVAGFLPFQARLLSYGLNLEGPLLKQGMAMMSALYEAFEGMDCSLAEINPLVVTRDEALLALDAKLNLDDNALFRHAEAAGLRDLNEEEPLEIEASEFDLNYIKLDGTIGCMVNGAGLAMATMDIIKHAGGEPANFLDVGGGANVEAVSNAFRILMSDPNVRAVLINIFGGIVRCDRVAQGVVEAMQRVKVEVPVVVRLEGTNAEEAGRILRESGLNFIVAEGLEDASVKAARAAAG